MISWASVPIHFLSTLAAVRTMPSVTTPGYVTPSGPVQPNSLTTAAIVLATAEGVAGCAAVQVDDAALDATAADVDTEAAARRRLGPSGVRRGTGRVGTGHRISSARGRRRPNLSA